MSALKDLFERSDNQQFKLNEESNVFEAPQHISSCIIMLSKYENFREKQLGRKGAAIVPNEFNKDIFNIICYETKNGEVIFSIPINPILSLSKYTFSFTMIDENSISFHDHMQSTLQWRLQFQNQTIFNQFITGLIMAKVPNTYIKWERNIIIQDLNMPSTDIEYIDNNNISKAKIKTLLKIWSFSAKHPFEKGLLVFSNEKVINMCSDKIIPAIRNGLNGVKQGTVRLIIASSDYCFGEKGNKTLKIGSNAPLIFEIHVKQIYIEKKLDIQRMILPHNMILPEISNATPPPPMSLHIGSDNVNIPPIAPWNEQNESKVDEQKESKLNAKLVEHGKDVKHERNDKLQDIGKIERRIKEKFILYEARLDSLSTGIERNNKLMVDMQNNMNKICEQINDLKLILVEEKKNDITNDMQDMRKELNVMKKLLNFNDNEDLKKVKLWLLNDVGLPQYTQILIENGFDNIDVIKTITLDDLSLLGIDKLGHKKQIIQNVIMLKKHTECEGVLAND